MPEILENADANLTPRMRNLVSMLWSEWKDLEQQIVAMNDEVEQIASTDPACQRLRQIPGIGPLVATAIVASIGNGAAFHKGREFASWMGLVPKTALNRREGKAVRHQQARQQLPAQDPRPRCPICRPPRSSENDRRSADGSMRSSSERRSTWSSRRQPTSWPASPGQFSRADKTYRANCEPTAACTLPHYDDDLVFSPRSAPES